MIDHFFVESTMHDDCEKCGHPSSFHPEKNKDEKQRTIMHHPFIRPVGAAASIEAPCIECSGRYEDHGMFVNDRGAVEMTAEDAGVHAFEPGVPPKRCAKCSQEESYVMHNTHVAENATWIALQLTKERDEALEKLSKLRAEHDYKDSVGPDDTRYRQHIKSITDEDARGLIEKDLEYGASWKKRGGVGAYFTMIRKVDRLNTQIPHKKHGYDIFAALMEPDVGAESLIDTCRDLRRYLTLIEAEVAVRLADLQTKKCHECGLYPCKCGTMTRSSLSSSYGGLEIKTHAEAVQKLNVIDDEKEKRLTEEIKCPVCRSVRASCIIGEPYGNADVIKYAGAEFHSARVTLRKVLRENPLSVVTIAPTLSTEGTKTRDELIAQFGTARVYEKCECGADNILIWNGKLATHSPPTIDYVRSADGMCRMSGTSPKSESFVAWPKDKPARYNGCNEPCDMWTGPCCCGATHKDGV